MLRFAFAAVIFLIIAWVIVAIYPRLASIESEKCVPAANTFAKFFPTQPPKPVLGEAFFDGGGNELTLADYRSKGVVLNFWATWCYPCVLEMPALDRLRAKISGGGVEVLTVSLNRGGTADVEKFYRKNRIVNLPVLIDRGNALTNGLGVTGLPTTVLIDAEGKEIGRVVGAAEWDQPKIVAFVRGCLAPARTPET
ncbi:MAG: TlpA disulfide reductase family protein [Rhodospirillales bacterium]|jgi:thiol-disulfide isomerase/thioredoxin|nr:TlpA disulfide reductase family protein [Rhodospirillales bacterium]HIJ43413.1 TlpA family protein disulfide reductase [Rhodospirillaceae bacterium]MDP7097134.1 TlpA disulfide reductase family protein [Rhodospirillales bacterium]MDP7214930.1 TlpA disulfide reductase family protein [Rhodospirillales bacterium]HIJ44579.1 TlpA family protein disulfide reductase [Rhodospirillaceae bacterium]